ncbi:MAG: O-antigen ligase family protein [Bacteroidales bacterium]|nr:O-antigen ligase family protein [Bacteroidales bacterium]
MVGATKLQHPLVVITLLLMSVVFALIIAKGGFITAVALVALIPALIFLNRLFNIPQVGIYALLFMSFLAIGLTRYIVNVPLGLSIDGLIVITYIALFFKMFYAGINFDQANRDISYLLVFWFAYAILEIANPQALSRTAWFYAMRGMSLYPILIVPLGLMLFNRLRFMYLFLYIWGVFTIIGTLKGLQQLYLGLDYAEQFWIDTIGGVTHIVLGQLRVFSFFSDAGQFGAAQGAAGVVGILVATTMKGRFNKIFFFLMGFMGLWGMMISGTRGAMIVPMLSGITYLILSKNVRILVIGGFVMSVMYVFFAMTYIGESNYQIARMRTAFRPTDDASYQVRLQNRAILKTYLADKPFGGGIGSAGNWGQRFSPQGFLANVATDSWYVQVWAEQGIVGLFIHLFILSYIAIKGFYLVMVRVKTRELSGILGALLAGYIGIMGASYGNGVLGQMPTGALVYFSWVFIFCAQQLDREYTYLESKELSPRSFYKQVD